MKYCDNCKRVFDDSARFCPNCGKELIEPKKYDIFGEELTDKKEENGNINSHNEGINYYKDKANEILAYLSIVLSLFPFVGTIVSMFAIYFNIKRKRKWLVVLSIVTLIISIAYVAILFITGTFDKIAEKIRNI